MKTLVIYHRSDFDGIFCREIAKKFLGDSANYVGLEYGDPIPDITDIDQLYILDFSVPEFMNHPGLIWIDHHKSAIEKFGTKRGFQIDGVAACRLAWQWFINAPLNETQSVRFATKEAFVNRNVLEPLAVQLAGEYDIWDKRNPNAELFQHGLRSELIDFDTLLNETDSLIANGYVNKLLQQGRALQFAKTNENASIIKSIGFTIDWEGLCFLACNHASYNSFLFIAGIEPKHDALFGFKWTGKDWSVSLYHAPGKEHHDLSLIAIKHGGGGHKGACGFRVKSLPFLS